MTFTPKQNPSPMRFNSFGGTHQGRVRPINEDRFLCNPENGTFLIADGMGGHSHGDIASSAIVQSVNEMLEASAEAISVDSFATSLLHANDMIKQISRNNNNLTIGSTVAGLLLSDNEFSVIWTGDSRVYLIRKNSIQQLTADHTEAEMLFKQGSITKTQCEEWPRKHMLVHAIGVNEEPHLEFTKGALQPDDRFVLCSDGLTNHLNDDEIQELASTNNTENACIQLIRLALERGGTDNVSVIVTHCVC